MAFLSFPFQFPLKQVHFRVVHGQYLYKELRMKPFSFFSFPIFQYSGQHHYEELWMKPIVFLSFPFQFPLKQVHFRATSIFMRNFGRNQAKLVQIITLCLLVVLNI